MIGSGEARRQFAQCQLLRRPGVYGLIAKNEIYIGMGGDVAHRIVYGSQIAGSIDTIFGIVGGNCAISLNDARAMERMLWSRGLGAFSCFPRSSTGQMVPRSMHIGTAVWTGFSPMPV